MRIPYNYRKLYCENCDEYNHDISFCKEFHQTMNYFKIKGKLAMIERFEKCSTYEEVMKVENELIAALKK